MLNQFFNSCFSPPFFALVHALLGVSCRRRVLLLMQPRFPGCSSPGLPPPGCSSLGVLLPRIFQSESHVFVRFSFPSFSSLVPTLFFRVPPLHRSLLLCLFCLPFSAATASSSLCSPGRSNPGPLLPRTFQSRASTTRMFQSECISSPGGPVRAPCACPLLLLLLLLPRPNSCSSCPLSPPSLALVHILLAVSCRRRFLLLLQPRRSIPGSFLPRASSQGPPQPGCFSPGALLPRMFQSGFHAFVCFSFFSFSPLFPTLVLRVFPPQFLASVHVLLAASRCRRFLLLL